MTDLVLIISAQFDTPMPAFGSPLVRLWILFGSSLDPLWILEIGKPGEERMLRIMCGFRVPQSGSGESRKLSGRCQTGVREVSKRRRVSIRSL
jgi:hypothetical protein